MEVWSQESYSFPISITEGTLHSGSLLHVSCLVLKMFTIKIIVKWTLRKGAMIKEVIYDGFGVQNVESIIKWNIITKYTQTERKCDFRVNMSLVWIVKKREGVL